MSDPGADVTDGAVLATFGGQEDPREPLATEEIADRLDCEPSVVTERLEALAERGEVTSKQIGTRARAWWRPDPSVSLDPTATQTRPPSLATSLDSEFLERVLDACPVGITVVDATGEIVFVNERAEEILGLARDEITNRTYRQSDWKIFFHDGTRVSVDEHPVTRVLETGEPVYGFEHWIELPNGTERWLSSNSAPVIDEEGVVDSVVVGFEDATQLKEREDKLTSNERRIVELASEELFRPFLDAGSEEARIDVDETVALPDGSTLQYLTATGIPTKSVAAAFEDHAADADVRLLRSTGDESRFEVRVNSPTVPALFLEHGGRVRSLVQTGTGDRPVLRGELPGHVDLRRVLRKAREIYPDLELVSQELGYSPRLLYDLVEEALTDRQFAVLQAAQGGGYFSTPRTSTGDELAEQFDITRQTFNQHLLKAEHAVFELLFEASGSDRR